MPSRDRSSPPERPSRVVAVVGGSSFLGRSLVSLLEEDDRVRRIVSLDGESPLGGTSRTRTYAMDLAGPSAHERVAEIFAVEGVDTVAHALFLDSPSHAPSWAHELESVGTMHVLDAARRTNVRKLVMSSTTLVYGARPENPNFLSEECLPQAPRSEPFLADKIDAEAEAQRFATGPTDAVVTILRIAPILGPVVENFVTRYLGRRAVPTIMGFDPLLQFVHESDAIAAFKLALDRDVPGVFNIVGDGVLPLSTAIKLAGHVPLPVPRPVAQRLVAGLWFAHLAEAPPGFLDYLQYLCVADGELARQRLGFRPVYSSREALDEFSRSARLRRARKHREAAG